MTAPFPEGRTASWPIVTPELIEHHRQLAPSERRTAIHAAMLWSFNQASSFFALAPAKLLGAGFPAPHPAPPTKSTSSLTLSAAITTAIR